jgi:4'-phosphopantetheinyl transferase
MGTVDVWRAAIDLPAEECRDLAGTLDDAERARASRFHFERDRRRYEAAHGRLRKLLGEYLGVAAESIALDALPGVKPCLRRDDSGLRFNLAHSGGLALFAFARGCEVGIDVEAEREVPEMEAIADRFFSPAEAAALRALPETERKRAFFRCWTRKEAFLKTTGEGLRRALDSFDVTLGPDEEPALVRVQGDVRSDGFYLAEVEVPAGYRAALVVEGTPLRVRWRDFAHTEGGLIG